MERPATTPVRHTPGPWTFTRDGRDLYIEHEILAGPGHGVFTIACLADGFGVDGTPSEADANARLIAAAPLLLEALQTAYLHALRAPVSVHRVSPAGQLALGAMRDALASAEGCTAQQTQDDYTARAWESR